MEAEEDGPCTVCARSYVDPGTGEILPTWEAALDAIGPHDEPLHVARFGHRADRKAWLMAMLDLPAVSDGTYRWQRVTPADPDHMPPLQRLMHVLADRSAWQASLTEARRRADETTSELSADRRAA